MSLARARDSYAVSPKGGKPQARGNFSPRFKGSIRLMIRMLQHPK